MRIKLLVTPLTAGAYFDDALTIAAKELELVIPHQPVISEQVGGLSFLSLETATDSIASISETLMRLSFVQAIFEDLGQGKLSIVAANSGFFLPAAMVYGTKYAGKTNELVTQMAINVGLAHASISEGETPSLLDPMAGRGTTLLWALRYRMNAYGIDINLKSLDGLQQHVKKQTKLKRIKHQQSKGNIGKPNKQGTGQFRQFVFDDLTLRLAVGDSRDAETLASKRRFHLIVSDLPYGVAHTTPDGTRNPLDNIRACAPAWTNCLRKGGAMVLIFNTYQPQPEDLAQCFQDTGLTHQPFSVPHRMSESIVRDLMVFTRT
jgi:hypothetical protein